MALYRNKRALASISVLALLASMATACEKKRRPSVYEVPQGFRGWVTIEFEVRACPPIPIVDDRYVFAIRDDGTFCTSSSPESGYAHDEYVFVGARRSPIPGFDHGGDNLIWGKGLATFGTGRLRTMEHFFVGTESEYEAAEPFFEFLKREYADGK